MCTLFNFVAIFIKQIDEFILEKKSEIKGIENLIN